MDLVEQPLPGVVTPLSSKLMLIDGELSLARSAVAIDGMLMPGFNAGSADRIEFIMRRSREIRDGDKILDYFRRNYQESDGFSLLSSQEAFGSKAGLLSSSSYYSKAVFSRPGRIYIDEIITFSDSPSSRAPRVTHLNVVTIQNDEGAVLSRETSGRWCQSNGNSSPFGAGRAGGAWPQAMRICHSAKAAERLAL